MTRNCAGLNNEFEPLAFSSYARVSKCKTLLGTIKEESSRSINLLRSILLYMKCDQSDDDGNVTMQLNQNFFLTTELYYQKKLTNQIKELIGDQIYFQCVLARQHYNISPSDEKWIVLFWLITLLDQKQWNLVAFLASKVATWIQYHIVLCYMYVQAIKEVDSVTKKLTNLDHQTDSLLVMLCHIPVSRCVIFQYLDVIKSHTVSALQSKYNVILSKLPDLSVQDCSEGSLLVRAEWLAKFWFMQKHGELPAGEVVSLTHPWQWFTNEGREDCKKPSCTVQEVTSALSEMFSLELEQILEQVKCTDQNQVVFFRYII